jgi:heterodisulfide reductase subunit A-like polyferredoxin
LIDLLPDARSYILYIDIRSHGKGYEDAYKDARRKGVTFIRGQPSLVLDKEDKLLVCGENTLLKELYEIESELVVLSVGLRTPETNQMMFGAAGIDMNKDGLPVCENELLLAESSKMKGVFFAGSVEAPKDIRDTVLHSKACALAVTKYLKG